MIKDESKLKEVKEWLASRGKRESASDIINTKLNSFMPELESDYLKNCEV